MVAKLFLGAATAVLAGATSAVGAPVSPPPVLYAPPAPPPGLPKGTRVEIPFSPPIGIALNYAYSRSDEKAGERKGAAFDLSLVFNRADAGYRMTVAITVRGLSAEQRSDPGIRMLEQPITYRLAADGQIVGMEDEDAYWRNVLQLLKSMEKDIKPGPGGRGLVEKMIRHMRSLPDDERMALATANIAPVLEMAGTHMAVGERVEIKGEEARLAVPTPAMARMRRDIEATLDRADSESASFTLAARYDDEATRAVMADLGSLAPPGKRPDPASLPFRITDTTTHSVSRSTGLSIFYTRRMEGKSDTGESYVRTTIMRALHTR